MEAVKCAHCGKEIHGRTDKRFCNDDCRNQFNRARRQRERKPDHPNVSEILKIIRNNYELLKKHGPDKPGKTTSGEGDISNIGIEPKFFTNISKQYAYQWFCCFDYCWKEEEGYWQISYQPDQAMLPTDYTEWTA